MGDSFKYLLYFATLAKDLLEYHLNADTVGSD
jgi:hypothetical protein